MTDESAGAGRARLDAERRRARRAAARADRADAGRFCASGSTTAPSSPRCCASSKAMSPTCSPAPTRSASRRRGWSRRGGGWSDEPAAADQRLRRRAAAHFAPHFAEWVGRGARPRFRPRRAGLRRRAAATRTASRCRRSGSGRCSTSSSSARCTARISFRARSRRCARSARRPTSSSSPISATIIRPTGSPSSRRSTSATACCATRAARAGRSLELIEEMRPSAAVFVDDLAVHHESVAKHAPDVWRLHMIAEPRLAAITPPAPTPMPGSTTGSEALPWILARLDRATRQCLARHDRHHLRPPRRARHHPARARRAGRRLCARRRAGGLLYISGQLPFREDGSLITGRLGEDYRRRARQRGGASAAG